LFSLILSYHEKEGCSGSVAIANCWSSAHTEVAGTGTSSVTGSLQEAGLSDGDDESNDTCGSFLAKQYALSFHMCQVLA
jgi:hypothetical protein